MKIIRNSIIPFKGYLAINLFGILFVRNDVKRELNDVDIIHESIHSEQIKELLYIPYYLWYVIEWFIKLFYYFSFKKAYRNISFEREAYLHEENPHYLNIRKHYSWFKYLIEKSYKRKNP